MNLDPSGMKDVIENFPKQFEDMLISLKDFKISGRGIKRVLVCGMGGSAFPGDLVHNYLKGEFPIHVHRGYHIPSWIDPKDTLIISSSYSGNTEETLSTLADAIAKKFKIVVVTAGGKLMETAKKEKLNFIQIPDGIPPRCATGYFFTSIMMILEKAKLVGEHHMKIFKLGTFLDSLDIENTAKNIAKDIKGKLPIIYSSHHFESIAKIWKIKFNENSKVQAFYNSFPELNHNELIGWTKLITNPYFIFIRHEKDHPQIKKRMEITREILREKNLDAIEVWMDGKNILEQMFSALYLADYVSYYLAIENKIDPYPVELVEEFKKRLSEFI